MEGRARACVRPCASVRACSCEALRGGRIRAYGPVRVRAQLQKSYTVVRRFDVLAQSLSACANCRKTCGCLRFLASLGLRSQYSPQPYDDHNDRTDNICSCMPSHTSIMDKSHCKGRRDRLWSLLLILTVGVQLLRRLKSGGACLMKVFRLRAGAAAERDAVTSVPPADSKRRSSTSPPPQSWWCMPDESVSNMCRSYCEGGRSHLRSLMLLWAFGV